MKVKFKAPFDWRVHPRQVKHFPAGWSGRVTRACGKAAIAAGVAEEISQKGKDDDESTDQSGL